MNEAAPPIVPAGTLSEVDPELLALPAPPRGRRLLAMTLMAAVVGLSLGLLSSVRSDLAYAFSPERAIDVGDAKAVVPGALASNRYVRVSGTPMVSGMVRFKSGVFGTEHVVFPLAGQRNVFVQVEAASLRDPKMGARSEFAGRLSTFDELGGRFRVVREFLSKRMDMPISGETYLVVADDPPGTHTWALLFAAFCVGVVGLNIWLFSRWFRPLRAR